MLFIKVFDKYFVVSFCFIDIICFGKFIIIFKLFLLVIFIMRLNISGVIFIIKINFEFEIFMLFMFKYDGFY